MTRSDLMPKTPPSILSTRSFTLYNTFPHPICAREEKRNERNACWTRLEYERSPPPTPLHLLNSTRSSWFRARGAVWRRRARSNLRQLSGGRRLDFANQEFVFPRGERDADGNLERKKVRRSPGEQTTTQEKLRGIFRRDKNLSKRNSRSRMAPSY